MLFREIIIESLSRGVFLSAIYQVIDDRQKVGNRTPPCPEGARDDFVKSISSNRWQMDKSTDELKDNIKQLAEAVVEAVVAVSETQELEVILAICHELRRLPSSLLTEVMNDVILSLVQLDPVLCRWFVLDIFLREADPEGKADVAERINLLIAELRSP